jgi:hypothetical protein
MPASSAAGEALAELAERAAALGAASGGSLLECFAAVPDPRRRRGIRHPLASVLALALAAVLSGNKEMDDVTAWVRAAPPQVPAACGARRNGLGARVAPSPDTVERIFAALGAQALASCAGAYLALRSLPGYLPRGRPGLAARHHGGRQGGARRGRRRRAGPVPAGRRRPRHRGRAGGAADRPEDHEVPEFAPLLRGLDGYYPLAGHVITADAGHTVKAHATLIAEELLAHYVLPSS